MEEKEKFKALAADMKPVIDEMNEVLKKHGIECLASVTLSSDGYATFSHHKTSWEMIRTTGTENFEIRNEYREVI